MFFETCSYVVVCVCALFAYVFLRENFVMLSVLNAYLKYVTCIYLDCRRWLLRRRGHWKGRQFLVEGRITRPDLARKFQRRKGLNSSHRQHQVKCTSMERRKDKRRGEARLIPNMGFLPPSQNHADVFFFASILLVMSPAIFCFCWQDLSGKGHQ